MSLEDSLELALRETRHRTRCSDQLGLFGVPQDRWVISVEVVVTKLLQQVWRSIALFRILFLFLHLLSAIHCFLIIFVTLRKSHPVAHSFQLRLSRLGPAVLKSSWRGINSPLLLFGSSSFGFMTLTTRICTLFHIHWSSLHSLTALGLVPHIRQKFTLPCCNLGAVLGRVILASDILNYTFRINRNMTFVYFYSFDLFQHFH